MDRNFIKQITTNLDNKDYQGAAQLLKQWQKQAPQDPWLPLYLGKYYEAIGKLDGAEKFYRQILRDGTNPKIIPPARQGLQRIDQVNKNRLQSSIALALSDPKNNEPGLLILEPITPENKQNVAQIMGKILGVDPYTTRMQLQSRGWRLYKTGLIGELQIYGQEMRQAGIPVFWVKLSDVQKLNVFRVNYFQSLSPPTIVCQDSLNRQGALSFKWSEITQIVSGMLPLFMEVMDYDPRRRQDKFRHKEITQDYAQIWDLHLPGRRTILRFCDHSYQFQEGVKFSQLANPNPSQEKLSSNTNTARINWNQLSDFLQQKLGNAANWSDFTPFAETTLDYAQMLSRIPAYIDLERKTTTPWDPAFQLYSSLVFLRNYPHN